MPKRNGTQVITGVVRASYLHSFEPWGANGQEPKYSVCALIPKTDKETIRLIQEAIAQATDIGQNSKWGGKVPKNLHIPLRDGDEEKDLDEHPEFEGMFFVNASSKRQPGMVDRKKMEIFSSDDLKSGDWVKLSLTFYPYAAAGNNGIGAGLNNIMKWKDGDSLGGSSARPESDFADEFDDGEDEEDELI